MRIQLPDYENCCVNLMSSIAKHFGITSKHSTLPLADTELLKNYKNIVVLLLDGFGQNLLTRQLDSSSFLRQNFAQELSAVYPSSTAPAVTSIKTGLTPIEHGWWGHNIFFKSLGQTINVFTNNDTYSRKGVSIPDVAHKILPYANIFDQITEKNTDVHTYVLCTADARDHFGISQVTYNTMDELSEYVQTLISTDGRHFIYAYHKYPDELMHKNGFNSDETAKLINDLSCQIEEMCTKCPDTLFFITADHGQTILRESRDLSDYPDLMNTLSQLPTGVTRCVSLYVKPHREKEFLKLIKKYFDDKFALVSKAEIIRNNLFGDGKPHPEIDNIMGDYFLCAISDCNITCSTIYGKPNRQPIGIHGGLTAEEMRVPLVIYGDKE